ncbi:DUF3795 domain-containing protein [Chloroflexota bacterium]
MDANLTSYCGLYCLDCVPSKEELFSLIRKVDILLEDLQFEEYAELKSEAFPGLAQYAAFSEVLKEIGLLQCHEPCRGGGGKEKCAIRTCCESNDRNGCWECDDSQTCDLLQPLIKSHPNLLYHYDLIRKHGIDGWLPHRKAHYRWQEEG